MKYLIIGDVHGRIESLNKILEEYGFVKENGKWISIQDYFIVSVGDLNDYTLNVESKSSIKCILTMIELTEARLAEVVQSNHQDKLLRWMIGRAVQLTNGLDNTVNEFDNLAVSRYQYDWITFGKIEKWLSERPYFFVLDAYINNRAVIACHAYFDDKMYEFTNNAYLNGTKKKFEWFKSCCIYGLTNGDGRIEWWNEEDTKHEQVFAISGHYHLHKKTDNYMILDTDDESIIVCDLVKDEVKTF